jgi:hypothetical protein
MRQHATSLLQEALGLTDEERAEVAGALLESLERQAGSDLPGVPARVNPPAAGNGRSAGGTELAPDVAAVAAAWRQEVAVRVAALEAGEVETTPWEAIRDQFLARLSEQRPG